VADVHLVEDWEVAKFLWEGSCQLLVSSKQVLKIFKVPKLVWKWTRPFVVCQEKSLQLCAVADGCQNWSVELVAVEQEKRQQGHDVAQLLPGNRSGELVEV